MLSVSLIRLYFRIRSLAVLEVRDGDAFTYERKGTAFFTGIPDACGVNTCAAEENHWLPHALGQTITPYCSSLISPSTLYGKHFRICFH